MAEEISLLEFSGSSDSDGDQVNNLKIQIDILESENFKLLGELNEIKVRNEDLQKLNKAQSEIESENFQLKLRNEDLELKLNKAQSKYKISAATELEAKKAGCNCDKKVADLQTIVDEVETLKENMAAKQKLLLEAEGRFEKAFLVEMELKEKLQKAEMVIEEKDERIEELDIDLRSQKEQKRILEELVQPLREQLKAFELEKRSLETKSTTAQGEINRLAAQYRSTIGHQKNNLKIQHWVKMEQENAELKTEIVCLKEQLIKTKRNVHSLEDKLKNAQGARRDPGVSFQSQDKENSMVKIRTPTCTQKQEVMQTPQGSGKPSRSPLWRVNRN